MNEIIPGLFIGDFQDAVEGNRVAPRTFVSINVAYEHKLTLPDSLYLPFMIPIPYPSGTPPSQPSQMQVNSVILDALAEIIDLNLQFGRKVLVNCNMGLERSPLAVMWFLKRKRGMTLDGAYELVKEKRPQIYDRRFWVTMFV